MTPIDWWILFFAVAMIFFGLLAIRYKTRYETICHELFLPASTSFAEVRARIREWRKCRYTREEKR